MTGGQVWPGLAWLLGQWGQGGTQLCPHGVSKVGLHTPATSHAEVSCQGSCHMLEKPRSHLCLF